MRRHAHPSHRRKSVVLLAAQAVVLLVASAAGAGSFDQCAAWIGDSHIALDARKATFEVTSSGALERLAVAPAVYSGRRSWAGWYGTRRAPRGNWVAVVRGQPAKVLTVRRGERRITVARDVAAGSVVWSPNGKLLAFVDNATKHARLASADDGFRARSIGAVPCSPFAWSRDSMRLAFIASTTRSCAPAPSRLLMVDPGTGVVTGAADLTAGVWSGPPTWSADDRFVSHSHSLESGIAIVPRSASDRPYSNSACTSASWAPTGHALASICDGNLAVIDAKSGNLRHFAASDPSPTLPPVWALDARTLATSSDTAFTITPLSGAAITIPLGGCVEAGIAGFDRATGRAVLVASVAHSD